MAYRGLDLKGRTAVVVGGTSGIGRAIAMGLANAGADVVASGRRPDQVRQLPAKSKPWAVAVSPSLWM